jgi:hypothetical protein
MCGAPDAQTMDHVFPKSLWSPPYPEDARLGLCHDDRFPLVAGPGGSQTFSTA